MFRIIPTLDVLEPLLHDPQKKGFSPFVLYSWNRKNEKPIFVISFQGLHTKFCTKTISRRAFRILMCCHNKRHNNLTTIIFHHQMQSIGLNIFRWIHYIVERKDSKKLTCKGTLRQVFWGFLLETIFCRSFTLCIWTDSEPTLQNC
jgi:hypothetical protein